MSGEASNRASIELPGAQRDLALAVIRAARGATGSAKPVVAVLMNGRPLAIPELAQEAPAILETWFLGNQHGAAVADVLFGDYNPGGKLPSTFPARPGRSRSTTITATPAAPPTRQITTRRSIWICRGRRSFRSASGSATRLSPTPTCASRRRRSGRVTPSRFRVDVRNTGDRAGDEVVQLYRPRQRCERRRAGESAEGISRRVTLQPGETRTVTFKLGPDAMSLYDRQMRRVVEPGTFTVFAGTNSSDVIATRFEVTGDAFVLAPPTPGSAKGEMQEQLAAVVDSLEDAQSRLRVLTDGLSEKEWTKRPEQTRWSSR